MNIFSDSKPTIYNFDNRYCELEMSVPQIDLISELAAVISENISIKENVAFYLLLKSIYRWQYENQTSFYDIIHMVNDQREILTEQIKNHAFNIFLETIPEILELNVEAIALIMKNLRMVYSSHVSRQKLILRERKV